jgi:ATP-dependent Lon protease
VILSRRNQKDLRDVPDEVKSKLKFDFVDTVQDVLRAALDLDVGEQAPTLPSGPTASPATALS